MDIVKHCKKCGVLLSNNRRIYCPACAIKIGKEKSRECSKRYRVKHGNKKVKLWRKEHPEESKLIARNWCYRHRHQCSETLKRWRRRNPEKLKAQNKRAKKNLRLREKKRLYRSGVYLKQKWKLTCPRCSRVFYTKAKRPTCHKCNYTFPRRYMERFIDRLKTSICKCCGREIPYQGKGIPRKYCECCLPQIMALKKAFEDKVHNWREYQREIVVAVTCVFCDTIIPGRRGKRLCPDCATKWARTVPQRILDDNRLWDSFKDPPLDLLVWKRIILLRKRGVYSL